MREIAFGGGLRVLVAIDANLQHDTLERAEIELHRACAKAGAHKLRHETVARFRLANDATWIE